MSDLLATIPLSAIRVFEAAARLKSFTRAADELGVTQAAVSWQVKALEQRLAQPLFRRLPREVALTPAGERLARAASEAVGLLRTALADLTETGEGVLAISTLQSLATQWLAPRLGGFQLAHPKIAVRLETSSRVIDLNHEPIDLALRGGDGQWPGLETHRMFSSQGTPVCTPAMREQLGGLARPEDLLDAPRIGNEGEWAEWFEAAGVTPPQTRRGGLRLEADLQAIEVASALAGQGVALASPILWSGEIARGQLVRPFPTVIDYGRGYWLAYPADRRRSPKIAAFRDWLLKVLAEDPLTATVSPDR
ncbi:LysR family glycine cleavage system transcriptional activator [Caulobacter ginsengisoli]|uniref:LysR family glycine cleavage system transcriptional activator n=1 Tax=Caulobacter ginsengisoli TaxID=400775 RepID=A0ABU0ITY8_9CAUL|nr:LysR substrate-binding domain-containing protein [Caulobacter ginsengisoli]MDQ0464821.1 LysR family glycine cleavage system transcriptional activator [Caulobacter ginsengisoli]